MTYRVLFLAKAGPVWGLVYFLQCESLDSYFLLGDVGKQLLLDSRVFCFLDGPASDT